MSAPTVFTMSPKDLGNLILAIKPALPKVPAAKATSLDFELKGAAVILDKHAGNISLLGTDRYVVHRAAAPARIQGDRRAFWIRHDGFADLIALARTLLQDRSRGTVRVEIHDEGLDQPLEATGAWPAPDGHMVLQWGDGDALRIPLAVSGVDPGRLQELIPQEVNPAEGQSLALYPEFLSKPLSVRDHRVKKGVFSGHPPHRLFVHVSNPQAVHPITGVIVTLGDWFQAHVNGVRLPSMEDGQPAPLVPPMGTPLKAGEVL